MNIILVTGIIVIKKKRGETKQTKLSAHSEFLAEKKENKK